MILSAFDRSTHTGLGSLGGSSCGSCDDRMASRVSLPLETSVASVKRTVEERFGGTVTDVAVFRSRERLRPLADHVLLRDIDPRGA